MYIYDTGRHFPAEKTIPEGHQAFRMESCCPSIVKLKVI